MLKREQGAESNGKLPHLFVPSETATLVPEFRNLGSCVSSERPALGQNTLMMTINTECLKLMYTLRNIISQERNETE